MKMNCHCGQRLAKTVLLVQPSSAAAERVFFSLLSNSFTETQTSSMEDYIESSTMAGNECIFLVNVTI